MADLTLSNAINSEYSELTGILTGQPNRVDVLVEDELDVPFWYDILSTERPDLIFCITPYQYNTDGVMNNDKGKTHILEEAAKGKLGRYYIGCVDSDYDFLLKSASNSWDSMCNKRIVQTYTYSIENLLCHPSTYKNVCTKCVMETCIEDFDDFIRCLSKILYPLLVWAMYMEKNKCGDFTAKMWGVVLDSSLSGTLGNILQRVQNNVDSIIKNLQIKHPESQYDLSKCEEDYLKSNNVTPDNCYQHIRGHDLYEFVLNSVLKPVTDNLKDLHFQKLRNSSKTPGNQINHDIKLLKNVEDVLQINYEYKKFSMYYPKMQSNIRKALGD